MRDTAITQSDSNSPEAVFRDCQRFLPRERFAVQNQENAAVYAKLRRAGFEKKKALKYCQTQHCKLDTTQKDFGPPGYKIFKSKFDKNKQFHGWQLEGKMNFKDQCEYQRIKDDTNFGLRQQPNDDLYQLYNRLGDAHRKTEERCRFTELPRDELITKLRSLTRDDNRKYNTPLFQLRRHNEIYYELADYFEKQQPPDKKSLITDLEAFDDIVPRKYLKQFYLEQKSSTIRKKPNVDVSDKIQRRSRILMELTALFTPARSEKRTSSLRREEQMRQLQNDSAITSLLDMDEGSQKNYSERCSILLFRYPKRKMNEDEEKMKRFQDSLRDVISQRINSINKKRK